MHVLILFKRKLHLPNEYLQPNEKPRFSENQTKHTCTMCNVQSIREAKTLSELLSVSQIFSSIFIHFHPFHLFPFCYHNNHIYIFVFIAILVLLFSLLELKTAKMLLRRVQLSTFNTKWKMWHLEQIFCMHSMNVIFRLGRKIGSGSFGDIYLGTNISTGEEGETNISTQNSNIWSNLDNTDISTGEQGRKNISIQNTTISSKFENTNISPGGRVGQLYEPKV